MKRNLLFSVITGLSLTAAWAADSIENPSTKDTKAAENKKSANTRFSQVRIDINRAVQTASTIQPGKVIKAELEEEGGSLVWEVEVLSDDASRTELILNATDGSLLRREASGK